MAEQRRRYGVRAAGCRAGLLLLPLLVAAPGPSRSAPPAASSPAPVAAPGTIAVRDVRPGMTGYGLTVFKGTQPERFAVRVLGVLHRFLPQTDIILIESDDTRLKHSGVAAGMSGSPIYLDGKLELEFEVGHGSQAAYECTSLMLTGKIDQQAFKRHDLDTVDFCSGGANQFDAFVHAEQALLGVVTGHGNDEAVENARRTLKHIKMTVGDGVEAAGVDRASHGFLR